MSKYEITQENKQAEGDPHAEAHLTAGCRCRCRGTG